MNTAQFTYNQYNYWNIPLYELPTRGIFYNKNAIIKLRGMCVIDVKFLATYQPAIATEVCNEILAKCAYFENISIEDLYLPDRMYLIFWIRNNSFMNRNGYTLSIRECERCRKPYEYSIRLEEFSIKYLNDFPESIYLPDIDMELPLTIPKFVDSLYKPKDDMETIALYINARNSFQERCRFIEELSAKDYSILFNHLDNHSCGFQTNFEIHCPHCGCTSHVNVKINDENMFCAVKLGEILETITRIAKYSHVLITNDWPWVEVEIEQHVINKLIKEEEEQNRKEIAKAKASAHVPSSVPHAHM